MSITEKTDERTLGERRVRTTFNPSASGLVDRIKHKSAELIDLLGEVGGGSTSDPETIRLIALARTAYEEAAMWAVKAATA